MIIALQAQVSVQPAQNPAETCVPLVVNSVSDSMSQSNFFSPPTTAAPAAMTGGAAGQEVPSLLMPSLR